MSAIPEAGAFPLEVQHRQPGQAYRRRSYLSHCFAAGLFQPCNRKGLSFPLRRLELIALPIIHR